MCNVELVKEEEGCVDVFWQGTLWRRVEDPFFDLSSLRRASSYEELEVLFYELEERAIRVLVSRWLSQRALFCKEVRHRLEKRKCSSVSIEKVIAYFVEGGVLDDKALLLFQVEKQQRKGRSGRMALRKWRGVEVEEQEALDPKREQEALLCYLHKKKVEWHSLDARERSKLFMQLLARGFSKEQIAKALQSTQREP